MRPVCFATILLIAIAATTEAHATTIPITVSGTETFTFESMPEGIFYETAPPRTLTGTGTYDLEDGYADLTFTTNAYIPGLSQTQYLPLDGDSLYYGGNPSVSVTFHYDPNGLSSGSFGFEGHDDTGYIDPSGELLYGINFYDAYGTITQTVTPEPSTMTLLGTGLLLAAGRLRKRRRA